MKVPKGNGVVNVPMKNAADFVNAARQAGTKTQVVSVETASDYASLVRLLGSSVRPFAVSILTIK